MVIMAEKKRVRPAPIYECLCCHKRFSARKGTPFFGLRKDNARIFKALHMLAERGSIRGTARVTGVTKDTVCRWLKIAAAQCEKVNACLIKDMNFDQAQLDELWTFVKKKTTYQVSGRGKK
jgi:transposase-like protein